MEAIPYSGNIELYLCEKATYTHTPINAILELTPLCNMNCDMCFVRLHPDEVECQGGLRSVEEWISLAREMQQAGTLFVLLTGGEPLLYPGFRQLYLELKRMGMIITLNTNGTLLDEEWADFFAAHPPRRINITLYGKDEDTYRRLCHFAGYTKTLRAIQLLLERKVSVKVNGSITPANVKDIEELTGIAQNTHTAWKFDTYMYPACRERSVSFSAQSRLSPAEAARARVDVLKKKLSEEDFRKFASDFTKKSAASSSTAADRHVSCRAGRSSFAVTWRGELRPCVLMPSPSVPVFDIGFKEAWRQIVEIVSDILLNKTCSTYTQRDICQTCAACAVLETGHFDGLPKYMCEYTKMTLQLLEKELLTTKSKEIDNILIE